MLLQPFNLSLRSCRVHFFIEFSGHARHRAAVGLLERPDRGRQVIWLALLAGQGPTEILVNDRLAFHRFQARMGRAGRLGLARIETRLESHGRIGLSLTDPAGEKIELEVEPSSTPGGAEATLIPAAGLFGAGMLPVAVCKRLAGLSPASRVVFNGRAMELGVTKKSLFARREAAGYYAEDVDFGLVFGRTAWVELLSPPTETAPGKHWEFQNRSYQSWRYRIVNRIGDNLNLVRWPGRSETLRLTKVDGDWLLADVTVQSANNQDSFISLVFDRPLPDLIRPPERVFKSEFTLAVNEPWTGIRGLAQVQGGDNGVELILQPVEPAWAISSPIVTLIKPDKDGFSVCSQVGTEPALDHCL